MTCPIIHRLHSLYLNKINFWPQSWKQNLRQRNRFSRVSMNLTNSSGSIIGPWCLWWQYVELRHLGNHEKYQILCIKNFLNKTDKLNIWFQANCVLQFSFQFMYLLVTRSSTDFASRLYVFIIFQYVITFCSAHWALS